MGWGVGFQSLLGFLMRCDQIWRHADRNHNRVSIPAGFSDALRPRFSIVFVFDISEFQSLLGFLMRCDATLRRNNDNLTSFQSLLGFLMRCDSGFKMVAAAITNVSIPAGFSDALRL